MTFDELKEKAKDIESKMTPLKRVQLLENYLSSSSYNYGDSNIYRLKKMVNHESLKEVSIVDVIRRVYGISEKSNMHKLLLVLFIDGIFFKRDGRVYTKNGDGYSALASLGSFNGLCGGTTVSTSLGGSHASRDNKEVDLYMAIFAAVTGKRINLQQTNIALFADVDQLRTYSAVFGDIGPASKIISKVKNIKTNNHMNIYFATIQDFVNYSNEYLSRYTLSFNTVSEFFDRTSINITNYLSQICDDFDSRIIKYNDKIQEDLRIAKERIKELEDKEMNNKLKEVFA